uniref:Uncharacterized protein n=1 Tax=viral metagenome TaxID=1070528 RepID=A0A6M3KKW0_9ZZZZ
MQPERYEVGAMTELERIERLEKLYEHIYHEFEIIELNTSKLVNVLLRYFPKSAEYRRELEGKIFNYRGLLSLHEDDIQGLKKNYHTHTDRDLPFRKSFKDIL